MPRVLPEVTLQDVVLQDLRGLQITVNPLKTVIKYQVRGASDGDTEVHHGDRIYVELPTAIKQALIQWIQGDVLDAINEKEEL